MTRHVKKVLSRPIRASRKGVYNLQVGDMICCRPVCRWPTNWTWRTVIAINYTFWDNFAIGVRYVEATGSRTSPFWIRPWPHNRKLKEISHLRRWERKLVED